MVSLLLVVRDPLGVPQVVGSMAKHPCAVLVAPVALVLLTPHRLALLRHGQEGHHGR
jgi:hypothetical protein